MATLSKPAKLTIFWSRMAGWLATSCAAPIAVFANKFGLLSEDQYKPVYDELGNLISETPPALNGWGILSCILVGFTLMSIIKEITNAYTGYSLTKQVLTGIVHSVMPLIIAFCICYFLEGVLYHVKYCLIVLIISKTVSIPLNPLPAWRYEKSGVEDYNDAIKTIAAYFKNKKEET